MSGEGGIRTPGAPGAQRFSRPPHSAALSPLQAAPTGRDRHRPYHPDGPAVTASPAARAHLSPTARSCLMPRGRGVRHCAVSSLLRHVSVMTSETLARAGTRGRPVVLEARAAQGRDMTGCGCPRCSHHRRTGAAQRKRTAEFQRSPLGALTQGPLMSALWTPGRAGVSPGSLRHGPARPSQVRPHRPLLAACAEGREAMTRRRLCLESACSTRVGIHWPRVVRTARRPHLPKVHPTLVQ